MSKENSKTQELVSHISQARDALDAALKLLQAQGAAPKDVKSAKIVRPFPVRAAALDFTMPLRPFVKKYGDGMNGAKKFTLLLAYLIKGDVTKTVALSAIEAQWNKMTGKGLLGMSFNRLYTSQARDNDWASTEKAGAYRLRPSWKGIFNG
jgi:hypothetical protein